MLQWWSEVMSGKNTVVAVLLVVGVGVLLKLQMIDASTAEWACFIIGSALGVSRLAQAVGASKAKDGGEPQA